MTANTPRRPAASMDRRAFLRGSAATAAGIASTGALASPLRAMAMPPTGYRALVIVNLDGGADCHAMLAPRGAAHAAYAAARGPLAVGTGDLLPLSGTGQDVAMHAQLSRMHTLYGAGRLAVVPNVGNLLEPMNAADYRSGRVSPPRQLFAHNIQSEYWQQGRSDISQNLGWAGLAGDLLRSQNPSNVPVNISLRQVTRLQLGNDEVPYTINKSGVQQYAAFSSSARRAALEQLLQQDGNSSAFVRDFAAVQRRAIAQHELIDAALTTITPLTTTFPTPGVNYAAWDLPGQLRMVAQLIAARNALGAQRQIFYVELGGWDSHNDPALGDVTGRLGELDAALGAFDDALGELGVRENVTTAAWSEFGRSLTSNGRGSDHGWGGHALVMGGSVTGGQLVGQFPDLALGSSTDAGAGRQVPTTSFDQLSATLLRWLGVAEADLPTIFPYVGNFPTSDLGFLT